MFTKDQIVAFLQPFIAAASGAVASYLLVHLHVLGIFHVTQNQVAQVVASALVFATTTILTWLSQHVQQPIFGPVAGVAPNSGRVRLAQILAFVQPYIAIVAGALAAWLFVHLHVLGVFHITQSQVAQAVSSGLVFVVVAGVTWASHAFKWLPTVVTDLTGPGGVVGVARWKSR